MKVIVNKDLCIGCGACSVIASKVFEMDEEGLARVILGNIPSTENEEVIDASESCPTGAISIIETK